MHGLLGAGPLLKRAKDGRLKAAGAQPPGGRLAGQGRLAHAAHAGQHHRRVAAEGAFQRQQLQRPPVKAVDGRRGKVGQRPPRRVQPAGGQVGLGPLPAGAGRDQHRVGAHLVELGDEPVFQVYRRCAGAEVEPAGGVGPQAGAGLLQRPPHRQAAAQLVVKALHQQPRRFDVDGVAKGHHAAHAALEQRRRDRTKDGPVRQAGGAAGLQQHQRHVEAGHQVAQRAPGDQVGGLVVALKTQRSHACFRQVGAVPVKVHDVVGPSHPPRPGDRLLQPGQRGRVAKVHRHLSRRQRLQRVEQRGDAVAGVNKAGVDRAADDEQDPQRQAQLEAARPPATLQLAADGDTLKDQRAAPVAHHLPRLNQHVRVGGADRQPARRAGGHQVAVDVGAFRRAKEGIEQGVAPVAEPAFDALRPGAVARAGELVIGLQVPAQVGRVIGGEGQGQRKRFFGSLSVRLDPFGGVGLRLAIDDEPDFVCRHKETSHRAG